MTRTAILCISLLLALRDPTFAQNTGARASFQFAGASLRSALDSLMRWFPLSIVYLDKDIEGKTVTASCSECGFEEAMSAVLGGTSLGWVMVGNQVILQERSARPLRPAATVSGILTDSLTGEWITGANVMLLDSLEQAFFSVRRWCPSNPYGFFSLRRVPPGRFILAVRALGYRSAYIAIDVTDTGAVRRDIGLRQENITLQEVTVEGRRTGLTAASAGVARGIYIRSTPSDQNEYYLDGARIYNPSHYGGVLSTFNAEVLNDVQVVVGGLPPYYGGRIGGILDLSMRDGTIDRLAGSAGTGSLGSHLSLEGPLGSATTFLVSGRRAYPDPLVPSLSDHGTPARLGSSEISAKISHELSGSSRLSLSGYLGRDAYDNHVDGGTARLDNSFVWGNRALSLRWLAVVSPSVFVHASAVYTKYDFSLAHTLKGDPFLPSPTIYASGYAVEDLSLRAHAEHYYDEEHTVRGGVELVHHTITADISPFSSQIAPLRLGGSSAWELAVYMQDQWRIFPRTTVEVGARATTFTAQDGSFSSVDPRFSLLFSLDENTRLYTALTSINQYLHPYRNSGLFLFSPSIFWYPSTDRIKPSTSVQVSLGVERGDDAYVVSAESFYRITHNLHEVVADTMPASLQDLQSDMIFGTGRSYGVEFSLRKRSGDLNGSVSYTLSWGSNAFAELNGGAPFRPRFDRRHELQIDSWYALNEAWAFGVLCVLASDLAPSLESGPAKFDAAATANRSISFIDLNGGRLPGFQRLELKTLHSFSAWGRPCQFTLRLVNGYGLLDPFIWELRGEPDVRMKWRTRLEEVKLFPLYPTVSLMVRF
jgi:hypothetical protein